VKVKKTMSSDNEEKHGNSENENEEDEDVTEEEEENEDDDNDSDSDSDNDGVEYGEDETPVKSKTKNLSRQKRLKETTAFNSASGVCYFTTMKFNIEVDDESDEDSEECGDKKINSIKKWKKNTTTSTSYNPEILLQNYLKKTAALMKKDPKTVISDDDVTFVIFDEISMIGKPAKNSDQSLSDIDDFIISKKIINERTREIMDIIYSYEDELAKKKIYVKKKEIPKKKIQGKPLFSPRFVIRELNNILLPANRKLFLSRGKDDNDEKIPDRKRIYYVKYIG
jgi:hypothetical protein